MAKKVRSLSKRKISWLAHKIIKVLEDKYLASDMSVYFNNKVIRVSLKFDKEGNPIWKEHSYRNIDPHDYFEYAAYDHIISISTEGGLYNNLNYDTGKFPEELEKLFRDHGIYWELGHAWNLSFFPAVDDDSHIAYTKYHKPKEPLYIWHTMPKEDCPIKLMHIMKEWYNLSQRTGDKGCCVLGAKMIFEYEGETYHMAPASPWQGEGSWTPHVDHIKNKLAEIGATNIQWNCGMLD